MHEFTSSNMMIPLSIKVQCYYPNCVFHFIFEERNYICESGGSAKFAPLFIILQPITTTKWVCVCVCGLVVVFYKIRYTHTQRVHSTTAHTTLINTRTMGPKMTFRCDFKIASHMRAIVNNGNIYTWIFFFRIIYRGGVVKEQHAQYSTRCARLTH